MYTNTQWEIFFINKLCRSHKTEKANFNFALEWMTN